MSPTPNPKSPRLLAVTAKGKPALNGEDFNATARAVLATIERARLLEAAHMHAEAMRSVSGLQRLISTIRASQGVHGFSADLLFGVEIAQAEALIADFTARDAARGVTRAATGCTT